MTQFKSDYEAEAYGVYLALAVHANVAVDVIDEDSLTRARLGAAEPFHRTPLSSVRRTTRVNHQLNKRPGGMQVTGRPSARGAALAQYRLVVVTQPNLPAEGMRALLAWAAAGGTLVTTSGAAQYDR
jgi:hypothetical protein